MGEVGAGLQTCERRWESVVSKTANTYSCVPNTLLKVSSFILRSIKYNVAV